MSLLEKIFPKQPIEKVNAEAAIEVENLKNLRFELSWSKLALAFTIPFAFVLMGYFEESLWRGLLWVVAIVAAILTRMSYVTERAISQDPGAVAAKVLRKVRHGPKRGVTVHYVFTAADGFAYTGDWNTTALLAHSIEPGNWLPVLYAKNDPSKNTHSSLWFHRVIKRL